MKKTRELISLEKIQLAKVFLLTCGCYFDKRRRMPITGEEMEALRLLLKEELETALRPFREEVDKHFDKIATQIDGLYLRDEKREQKYLSIREQFRRLEARIA